MIRKSKGVQLDPNTTDTLIGEGSVFDGNIQSVASIRIEGKVVGEIKCEGDVTIGEKGIVESNVFARNVIIAGQVNGNIQAKNKISISSSGKIFGNISASVLVIEEGSVFEGSCRMNGNVVPAEERNATQSLATAAAKA